MSETEAAKALRSRIEEPRARLTYVLEHFNRCRGIRAPVTHRAFNLAAEVLSTDYEAAKYLMRVGMFPWSFDRARFDLIGPIRDDVIGFVYRARIVGDLTKFKIGFTRQPEIREQQLSREHGRAVRIESMEVGTMLEEHAAHCEHKDSRIVGEWFEERAA